MAAMSAVVDCWQRGNNEVRACCQRQVLPTSDCPGVDQRLVSLVIGWWAGKWSCLTICFVLLPALSLLKQASAGGARPLYHQTKTLCNQKTDNKIVSFKIAWNRRLITNQPVARHCFIFRCVSHGWEPVFSVKGLSSADMVLHCLRICCRNLVDYSLQWFQVD